MTYEKFKKEIKNKIKNYLPEEYQTAAICINEIPKNNGVVKSALSVTPSGDGMARQIYLEGAYQEYCDNPSMEHILSKAAQFIMDAMEEAVVFNPAMVSDFQQVQGNIVLRVVNKDNNQNQLQSMPYREIDNTDLIATYRIDVSLSDTAGSILVSNEMMERWGIGESDLYERALQNTQQHHPFTLQSMESIMGEIAFGFPATVEPNQLPAQFEPYMQYLLSNEDKCNGATCLLYPDLLKEIGAAFDSNFFILPSSVHELILMKDTGEMSASELQRMVLEVNGTEVEPEEVLSNQVFSYNYRENSLSTATTKEETAELLSLMSENYPMDSEHGMDEDMERE